MEQINQAIDILDYAISTKVRRHIIGGALLSISTLFGGLAITIMTISKKEQENE